jgi:hypothetical protein
VRCEECGRVAEGDARGWEAHRADDPSEGNEPEVVFFCPDCAEWEFGRKPLGEADSP